MVNIIDTPPVTRQQTDRDRVSILEIVGCAALLSTILWTLLAALQQSPFGFPRDLLEGTAPWLTVSIVWATAVCLIMRGISRVRIAAAATVLGALLPAALTFFSPSFLPAAIVLAITTLGTASLMLSPRMVRGICAIAGFVLALVFFTVAFGQWFISFLRG